MLTSDPITTIAIVGAGFSGCLVAVHLLKTANRPLLIELIDRSHEIGLELHTAPMTPAIC
jgi:uncharacterized NAD(P)/FAD-binding protein YdhS